jgi:hypothetical protein
MLTYAPPTPAQAIFASKAAVSVGITYPLAVAFSKLSLLLLLRRIFGMRVMWFRIGWWLNIVLIFPCWLGVALTFGSLQVAGAALDPKIQGVSIPFVSFMNAATDATILILPIGTTLKLQLNRRSQISVIGIFAFGLLYVEDFLMNGHNELIISRATSISLVRAIRSVQAANEGWYPRYTLYQSALTGAAETSIIFICSCLPMLGPLFAKFKQIAVHTVDKMTSKSSSQGGSRMTSRLGSRKPKSAVTLTSREYPDNARLNENVIYQEREFELHESNSADHVAHKQQHQVTTTPF